MSAIGKTKTKLKEGAKEIIKEPQKALVHFGLGIGLGVAVDIFLEWVYWLLPARPEEMGAWKDGIPIGFSIYYANPNQTIIPWDDVVFFIIAFAFVATKKFWILAGYLLGGYISSNEGLYGKIAAPFLPEEALP